jgi:hypothetical protein
MNNNLEQEIFGNHSEEQFGKLALEIYRFQKEKNPVYKKFVELLGRKDPTKIEEIPFMPISFFKGFTLNTETKYEKIFTSSGTSNTGQSKHYVSSVGLYEKSCWESFSHFFGSPNDYIWYALLPNYLEREGSSLVYMMDHFIKENPNPESGFFLYDHKELYNSIKESEKEGKKAILLGVSFALLDFFEKYTLDLQHTLIMETGGMKGQRKEITREELHGFIQEKSGVKSVYSEYGMTELLSQAYSKGKGIFTCPPWMKILPGDTDDPLGISPKTHGNLRIIDFSNLYSCSFIQTDDLGKFHKNEDFEVVGRMDYSDVRGCNLMVL